MRPKSPMYGVYDPRFSIVKPEGYRDSGRIKTILDPSFKDSSWVVVFATFGWFPLPVKVTPQGAQVAHAGQYLLKAESETRRDSKNVLEGPNRNRLLLELGKPGAITQGSDLSQHSGKNNIVERIDQIPVDIAQ